MISGVGRWPAVRFFVGRVSSFTCCVAVFCARRRVESRWRGRGERARKRAVRHLARDDETDERRRRRPRGSATRVQTRTKPRRVARDLAPLERATARGDRARATRSARARETPIWDGRCCEVRPRRALRSAPRSSPVVYARYLMCVVFLGIGGEFMSSPLPQPFPPPAPPPIAPRLAPPRSTDQINLAVVPNQADAPRRGGLDLATRGRRSNTSRASSKCARTPDAARDRAPPVAAQAPRSAVCAARDDARDGLVSLEGGRRWRTVEKIRPGFNFTARSG